jgi:acyl carrier protein
MNHTQRVREFVRSNFLVSDDVALTDQASLLELGIVDSTGVLEIIAFLERTFGLAVDDDEIVPENLDSIERIAAYVARKQGAATPRRGAQAGDLASRAS